LSEGGDRQLADVARSALVRLSDAQLATVVGAALFVLAAWPLALTDVPPYQDLPNHLASVTVIQHPESYPEFVATGFLKTNAALFAWLYFVGKLVGSVMAAKLFALGTLAASAFVLPRFVLRFGGRERMVAASFLAWAMVHNWFVSMGMLDFALGVPLSLATLIALDRHRERPAWSTGAAVLFGTLATWYAHVFPLMVVHLLVTVHVLVTPTLRGRLEQVKRLAPPLLPSALLVLGSLYTHFSEKPGPMTGYVLYEKLLPPWELFYNVWAEWHWGFSWLSFTSLATTLGLAYYGYKNFRRAPTFFSPVAFGVLILFYFFTPYIATNWFHVNSRFIPFLWLAAMLRVPTQLPRRVAWGLALCAALYSIGMGVDFVRLERDRVRFTAAMHAVPQHAKLLPLVFKAKLSSQNTRSLLHAWGFYVMEKQTAAPLLFAHSRSFPVMYRDPPPPRFNHLVLEPFAPSMRSAQWGCNILRAGGVALDDCEDAYRARWAEFWRDAEPRFDHVLMWEAPREVRELVPSSYRVVFESDKLVVYGPRTEAAMR
jgi:hypothetical protein